MKIAWSKEFMKHKLYLNLLQRCSISCTQNKKHVFERLDLKNTILYANLRLWQYLFTKNNHIEL